MDNKMFEDKLKDNTIIEAGHYSYKTGPTELDEYLWDLGVQLYKKAKENFQNIGLLLLVDDVHDIDSNEERKSFQTAILPEKYLEILKKYSIIPEEVNIISQDRIREKGRQLLRKKGLSRNVPQCRLIVATLLRHKELKGFSNAINLYDSIKSDDGAKLVSGEVYSRIIFNTKMQVHSFIFNGKEDYKYFFQNNQQFSDQMKSC
jgi:hypothetical protein